VRLLIISGIFHPDVGGPATYLRRLADTLEAAHHTVAVVTYGDVASQEAYPVYRISRRGSPLARLARFTTALARRSSGFDTWYVNDYGVPAALVALIRRPRIVMKIVGDFPWEYARRNYLIDDGIDAFQRRRYGPKIQALKFIQRWYVRRADRVIVPSDYLAGLVSGWGVSRDCITVVKNAVPSVAAASTPRDPATIFAACRLAPWKGVDHLLHAVAAARPRVAALRLVVAGGGPEETRLKALAKTLDLEPIVTWLGDISHDAVHAWMDRATVFALFSEYEGLPHVLLEALAHGTPIVASAAGGNLEVVRAGYEAVVIDPPKHADAGKALADLLLDPVTRARMSVAARQRAALFEWDALMLDTIRVIDETAAHR
jgi:glycosyltransferase involved in cell wall biosynthesis